MGEAGSPGGRLRSGPHLPGPHEPPPERDQVHPRGPGLAEEELPRIFDRYWQASAATREGLGLGLAICRGIEPETLFWAAWRVLPRPRRQAIAREVVLAVVERVENAWSTLAEAPLAAGDPVRRELAAWARYEARRPVAWRGLG